jgi:hypothetical protein
VSEQKAKDDTEYWERQMEEDPENWEHRWWQLQVDEARANHDSYVDLDEPCGLGDMTRRQYRERCKLFWASLVCEHC